MGGEGLSFVMEGLEKGLRDARLQVLVLDAEAMKQRSEQLTCLAAQAPVILERRGTETLAHDAREHSRHDLVEGTSNEVRGGEVERVGGW